MASQNLLVELLVEELPPKALKKLGEAFAMWIRQGLIDELLVAPEENWEWFATPRRLAVKINNVEHHQKTRLVTEKLMPASVAYDTEGNPTQALTKRLKGKTPEQAGLQRRMEGNAEMVISQWTDNGFSLSQILGDIIEKALEKLPIPKVMTYQLSDGWTNVQFVRPAHSMLILHGNDIVEGVRTQSNENILGLKPGCITQGHRFEAAVSPIVIKDADSYAEQLKTEGAVIASFAQRRAEIERQLNAAAAKQNLKPIDDDALLDEVTALVERPNVLVGEFEKEFLEVPQECLILTMKANQKYFPLLDTNNKLTNKFLIVSNITPKDPSAVISGNERVVRPRLADAKFFFDQDRKKTLESRIASLDKMVYHNKLGSQGERTERVRAIAKAIGQQLGGDKLAAQADKAAQLAKTDLVTDMVGEFPELQGIMGRYYAQHEKLDDDIAFAIEDHYKPRFAGDELPRSQVGICVALADKLETLVGMFGIGEKPTGEKDPFGLRRQALGVVRILIEKDLPLELAALLLSTIMLGDLPSPDGLGTFIFERLRYYLSIESFDEEAKAHFQTNVRPYQKDASLRLGYSSQQVEAALALNPQRLGDIPKRLEAVSTFALLPEAPALAAANKRVGNILKKAEGEVKTEVKANLLQEPAEIALNATLSKVKPEADKLFESGDYTKSLKALAALKAPVDDFFDNVMVNADDPALKANRLGLLATLHQAMNRVADISKLAS